MGEGVRSWPRVGAPAEPGFQGRGAAQAIGDAGEDDGEIGGAEGSGEEGEAWGGGALLDGAGELLAVVDQFADDAEDAAEGGGHGCVGPGRIGVCGWGGRLGGHERNENTEGGVCQGEHSCTNATRGASGRRNEVGEADRTVP